VTLERLRFEGFESVRLAGPRSDLVVTISAGPRILGLLAFEGNLLAILPDSGIDLADGGRYRFIGGHRLWVAPEIPEITYQRDERACTATEVDGGVRVEGPADGAGLVKSIEARPDGDGWVVDHALRNDSDAPMTIAPWAITQLPIGGEIVLPIPSSRDGVLPDRALVLWPYTDLSDPRIRVEADALRIDAAPGRSALKVGAAPGDGTVAYRRRSTVFEKTAILDPDGEFADRGAAVQVYVCDEFCELETLGALATVAPGDAATHRERWSVTTAPSD
jgi:hypothetical protein